MIGILIVTHGKMAEGIADSARMIMGNNEQFDSIGLFPDKDLDQFKADIKKKFLELDTGDGVIIFVDLFGASPYNITALNIHELLSEKKKVRVITGVNLPMVIEVLNMRNIEENIDSLYKSCLTTGKDGIKELLEEMASNECEDDEE
ncbi:PTS sugar transporter subunit IIA [Acidilutibacter cellobiosedens]|jgi:mannose/fructose/sorbose-specific phosphotransferase system IIA component|uniref:PTS sugar transporter subunit IIA n=1 Tax=Acidilutibacter cellobiosedens TaxID=2507161 RepID=A0A410Q9Z7_9FIRM|nr:PTS sugar transporter subunit IIA [Acidilutibacter cellobiosedens]QAT60797.1 PTS sugar transporter subunit IIA [Acidilutibacter cellobiosedens]